MRRNAFFLNCFSCLHTKSYVTYFPNPVAWVCINDIFIKSYTAHLTLHSFDAAVTFSESELTSWMLLGLANDVAIVIREFEIKSKATLRMAEDYKIALLWLWFFLAKLARQLFYSYQRDALMLQNHFFSIANHTAFWCLIWFLSSCSHAVNVSCRGEKNDCHSWMKSGSRNHVKK